MNILQGMRVWSSDAFDEKQKKRTDELLEKSLKDLPKLKQWETKDLREVGLKQSYLIKSRATATAAHVMALIS